MSKTIAYESCSCGHSKDCHGIHQLDKHGANCNQCNCTIYTWSKFIFCEDLIKETIKEEDKK